jgi:hypothetical protein
VKWGRPRGGRTFSHLAAAKTLSFRSRLAAQVGQIVAFSSTLLGLFRFFVGSNFSGLWPAFVGWFLHDASRASYVQVEVVAGLRARHVDDMMDRDFPTGEAHLSLQDFVDEYLLRSGRRCFVALQNNQVAGLINAPMR